MSAHLVTPRRIRLARRVDLVPQLGHDDALVDLAVDAEHGALAALDARPSVRVWSLEPCDVMLIAPLPRGQYDAVRWTGDGRLAVRQRPDEGQPLWWVREPHGRGRWRPMGSLLEIDPSLAETVRVDSTGESLAVVHTDGRRVEIEGVPATASAAVDSLARFVAVGREREVCIHDADDASVIERFDAHEAAVIDLALNPAGDMLVSCDADGAVRTVDPLRGGAPRLLAEVSGATCIALDGDAEHVLVGDDGGQISMFDLRGGRRVLRTAKQVRGFEWELCLSEQVGYLGARPESFGCYLDPEHAIQPVRPLPGRATTVCAGSRWPMFLSALDDGRIMEIDLASGSVTELTRTDLALSHVAASEFGVFGVSARRALWHDGESVQIFELDTGDPVRCVAIERKGAMAAIAYDDRIELLASSGKSQGRVEGIGEPVSMAFVRYRNRRTLVVVDGAGVLWRYAVNKGSLSRAGVVELDEDGGGTLARVGALVVDEDDTLRALGELDNAHRCLLMLDVKSATATMLLGAVVYGHQLVAVYDEDGTWLRQDEQRNVRMVSDRIAYEPQDWLRRPEPGLA